MEESRRFSPEDFLALEKYNQYGKLVGNAKIGKVESMKESLKKN